MDRMMDPAFFRRAASAAALVTQMSVATLIGLLGGAEADRRLGSEPWLLLCGVTLGFTLGTYRMIRGLTRMQSENDADPQNPP